MWKPTFFGQYLFVCLIKHDNHARQTSIQDNNCDSLRAMWLHSRQDIRQFDKHPQKSKKANHLTQIIHGFFIINEDGKKWSFSGQ